jgi:adenosylcobinamide-GDP ribazoletransferase
VDAPWLVGAAALVSRSTVCLMAYLGRYPRAEGTGKLLIETMDLRTVVLCVALASVAILACPISGTVALSSIGVASAAFALLAMLCQRRLGGITGDCLGAGIELVEVTALLVAAV